MNPAHTILLGSKRNQCVLGHPNCPGPGFLPELGISHNCRDICRLCLGQQLSPVASLFIDDKYGVETPFWLEWVNFFFTLLLFCSCYLMCLLLAISFWSKCIQRYFSISHRKNKQKSSDMNKKHCIFFQRVEVERCRLGDHLPEVTQKRRRGGHKKKSWAKKER